MFIVTAKLTKARAAAIGVGLIALIAVIVIFMAETCGPDRCLTDYTTYKGLFDSPLALGGSVLVQ